jgi:hypothetical protein
MFETFIIVIALLASYFTIHWLYPCVMNRRRPRSTRSRSTPELQRRRHDAGLTRTLHAPRSRAFLAHPAFKSNASGGFSEQQGAVHFPAYRSIRDLDQGRKLEVGQEPGSECGEPTCLRAAGRRPDTHIARPEGRATGST